MSTHTDQYSLAAAYAELRLYRTLFASGMCSLFRSSRQAPDLAPLPQAEQKVLPTANCASMRVPSSR